MSSPLKPSDPCVAILLAGGATYTKNLVKARAIELLCNGEINGYLPTDLVAANRSRLQDQIIIAVCIARDELIPREMWMRRPLPLNKAAQAQMVREIKREFLVGQHAEDEPKFSDFMWSSSWPDFVTSNDELYRLLLDRGVERHTASEQADHLWGDFSLFDACDWRWRGSVTRRSVREVAWKSGKGR
jgi:hypothetical protein